MQNQQRLSLKLTIAKLELKQLEVIDRLSDNHDCDIIRCITHPKSMVLLAVNGDWEKITGYSEKSCVGRNFSDFIPERERRGAMLNGKKMLKDTNGFDSLTFNIQTRNGEIVEVNWKSKHFPEIDSIVSIGKVVNKKTTHKFKNIQDGNKVWVK